MLLGDTKQNYHTTWKTVIQHGFEQDQLDNVNGDDDVDEYNDDELCSKYTIFCVIM